jgi:hypothetical protein
MRPQSVPLSRVSCLLCACLCAVGCGRQRPAEEPLTPTRANLIKIGASYTNATFSLNHPPANRAEFLKFVKQQGNPDDVLRSPGDKEDFVIVYGVDLRNLKATGDDVPILAYEKRGTDGKRHVLRGRSEVLLMTENELKAAAFPPGYTPSF